MRIDVFADIACPWCYIGEARLHEAMEQRPDLTFERHWRPFQLQPTLPAEGMPWRPFAEVKFGGWQSAMRMFDHVAEAGAQAGVTFHFDRISHANNTTDAHRLVLLAESFNKQWAMADALFRAYFAEGRNLNDLEQLVEVAGNVGLPTDAVREYLRSDEGRLTVERAQQEAYELGVQGVPFFVFENRFAVSGAQPVEVFLRAIDTARAEIVKN
ncbi:MAG: DsbA family oxidoreductase [Chloroflexi bacterium]|nr:DsbA family oxidoreductase [Chloroflexota bacterium]